MIVGTQEKYDETLAALERIQKFVPETLVRESELGTALSFREAVDPAKQHVDLFKRLSVQALEDFPDHIRQNILTACNNLHDLLQRIISFDPGQGNPQGERNQIISTLKQNYIQAFSELHPYISYSLYRVADFQRLDAEARESLESVKKQVKASTAKISGLEREAAEVLQEIRKVAAEQGVSQMAVYFRDESQHHDRLAREWSSRTTMLAWTLVVFAGLSMFIHKIPYLSSAEVYDMAQIAISKAMIFAVIAYMLFLSARNFMSHKHNAVVNKHRQNALLTHKALIEATTDVGARDAVMIHAAGCIFSPQPTGYTLTKSDNDSYSPRSVVELLSKPILTDSKP